MQCEMGTPALPTSLPLRLASYITCPLEPSHQLGLIGRDGDGDLRYARIIISMIDIFQGFLSFHAAAVLSDGSAHLEALQGTSRAHTPLGTMSHIYIFRSRALVIFIAALF